MSCLTWKIKSTSSSKPAKPCTSEKCTVSWWENAIGIHWFLHIVAQRTCPVHVRTCTQGILFVSDLLAGNRKHSKHKSFTVVELSLVKP